MCHRSQKDQNPKNTLSSLTDDNAFSVYASAVDTCRYNADFTQNHICLVATQALLETHLECTQAEISPHIQC